MEIQRFATCRAERAVRYVRGLKSRGGGLQQLTCLGKISCCIFSWEGSDCLGMLLVVSINIAAWIIRLRVGPEYWARIIPLAAWALLFPLLGTCFSSSSSHIENKCAVLLVWLCTLNPCDVAFAGAGVWSWCVVLQRYPMAIALAPVFREVSHSTKLVWSLQKQNNLFASRPCGIEMHEPRQEGNFCATCRTRQILQ